MRRRQQPGAAGGQGAQPGASFLQARWERAGKAQRHRGPHPHVTVATGLGQTFVLPGRGGRDAACGVRLPCATLTAAPSPEPRLPFRSLPGGPMAQ